MPLDLNTFQELNLIITDNNLHSSYKLNRKPTLESTPIKMLGKFALSICRDFREYKSR